MIDKDFCLSSYIAFRYIYKDDVDFFEGMHHKNFKLPTDEEKIYVKTALDIDETIKREMDQIYSKYTNVGILLSGGMDSAILAAYMKSGSHAYTFASTDTDIYNMDIQRAKYYCNKFGLKHHLVNISFEDYKEYVPVVMKQKCAPVHSIEPQIYKAAQEAKQDGVEIMIIGDGADYVFGGMDKLLAVDWDFEAFVKRYITLDPTLVLAHPIDMREAFEPYRLDGDKIDFQSFLKGPTTIESYGSYKNAFDSAEMPYYDPYEKMEMVHPLDLERVRNGESKYLIRELYSMKYPEIDVPTKIPMPRPVDLIFQNWKGPKRKEFRDDIPMNQLTGNQKWQLWCAERFLDINEG